MSFSGSRQRIHQDVLAQHAHLFERLFDPTICRDGRRPIWWNVICWRSARGCLGRIRPVRPKPCRALEDRGLTGVVCQHCPAFEWIAYVGVRLCQGDHRRMIPCMAARYKVRLLSTPKKRPLTSGGLSEQAFAYLMARKAPRMALKGHPGNPPNHRHYQALSAWQARFSAEARIPCFQAGSLLASAITPSPQQARMSEPI